MNLKRNFLNIVVLLFATQSCASWVESAKKMMDGDETEKKKEVKWVSQNQYNDLLVKYNTLNEENQKLKEAQLAQTEPIGNYNQIDELSKSVESTDAIDVFKDEDLASSMKATSAKGLTSSLVSSYSKAIILKENGKLKDALGIFQKLEKSSSNQIVVRARYQIAQIYYNQNQFDLALQVYESIILNNSFSSIVLKALNGAILCSKSLGLKEKQLRYKSVLEDFFGMNS